MESWHRSGHWGAVVDERSPLRSLRAAAVMERRSASRELAWAGFWWRLLALMRASVRCRWKADVVVSM